MLLDDFFFRFLFPGIGLIAFAKFCASALANLFRLPSSALVLSLFDIVVDIDSFKTAEKRAARGLRLCIALKYWRDAPVTFLGALNFDLVTSIRDGLYAQITNHMKCGCQRFLAYCISNLSAGETLLRGTLKSDLDLRASDIPFGRQKKIVARDISCRVLRQKTFLNFQRISLPSTWQFS